MAGYASIQLNEQVFIKQYHWARPDHSFEEEDKPEAVIWLTQKSID